MKTSTNRMAKTVIKMMERVMKESLRCQAAIIQARKTTARTISDRLWSRMEVTMLNPRVAHRIRFCGCANSVQFCVSQYARLNMKGSSARLIKAGYLPQLTAWAGIYQPNAARTIAKMPALFDPV